MTGYFVYSLQIWYEASKAGDIQRSYNGNAAEQHLMRVFALDIIVCVPRRTFSPKHGDLHEDSYITTIGVDFRFKTIPVEKQTLLSW